MISAVTEAEILIGLELKPEASRHRASVARLFETVEIRSWDSRAAQGYARLRARLKTTGKALRELDLLIASHALAEGAVLVSHDKAFQNVPPFLRLSIGPSTFIDFLSSLKA